MSPNNLPQFLRKNIYYASYYITTRFGRRRPLLAGIKLSHDCNLRCDHCPFWKKKGPRLSFQQAVSAMRKLYKMGVRLVIFEGGEPFLWKDGGHTISDIVAEAKKFFFSTGITTNGTFPIAADADLIWVSIDGLRNTHNRLRCGSFDTLIENIQNSSHPKIFAHITINSENFKEISDVIKFLSSYVRGITIQFHYPYREGEADMSLSQQERQEVLDTLIRLKKKGFLVSNSFACLNALRENRWKCHAWMIASVDPDGTITNGCYIQNRGVISCEKCGFSAHTEISLAYSGVIESIRLKNKIFG